MEVSSLYNIIIIVLCLFFDFVNKITTGEKINIARLQNWTWIFVFFIYAIDIFHYYTIVDVVYLWAGVYISTFNIAYLISVRNKRQFEIANGLSELDFDPYIKRIEIASIICWIVSIPILQISVKILLSSGMSILRYKIYGATSIFTSTQMIIIMYFMRPVFLTSIMLFAIMLANKKVSFGYTVFVILNIVDYTLMTSGRALMVQFFISVTFAIVFFNGVKIWTILKRYKRFSIPGAILLCIAIYISTLRITGSYGFLGEGMIYYTAGFPYLSELTKAGHIVPYSYFGRLIFAFLIDDFLLALRVLGLGQFDLASNAMSAITAMSYKTAPNIGTNATSTLLMDLVMDAGIIGIIFGAVFLALLSSWAEKRFKISGTILACAFNIMIMEKVFIGIQGYFFEHGYATFEILLLVLLLYPVGKKRIRVKLR